MIAADTSIMIAFLAGEKGHDILQLKSAIHSNQIRVSPVVVTELLSDWRMKDPMRKIIAKLPRLEITEGFWERAGQTRALLLSKKLKAFLPDTLIAQSCIDHSLPLLTRDSDFKHFEKHAGLILL